MMHINAFYMWMLFVCWSCVRAHQTCAFFSVRMSAPDDYARCVNDCSHGNQFSVLSERCRGVRAGRGERQRQRERE